VIGRAGEREGGREGEREGEREGACTLSALALFRV